MNDELETIIPRIDGETPNAYRAFLDYVNWDAERYGRNVRSLPALAAYYERISGTKSVPTKQLSRLKVWSSHHNWQNRLTTYLEAMQAEADAIQRERLAKIGDSAYEDFLLLQRQYRRMMEDFPRHLVTRRETRDDPRDMGLPPEQRRQVDVVTMRVNANDLSRMAHTFGEAYKSLLKIWRVPDTVDVTSDGKPLDWRSDVIDLVRTGQITLEQIRQELGEEIAQELVTSGKL